LVAQYLIQNPSFHNDIDKINRDFTPEILAFVIDSGNVNEVAVKVFDALAVLKKHSTSHC